MTRNACIRFVAITLIVPLLLPTAGARGAASPTLIPNIGKDLVAAVNGGNVAFASSDESSGSLAAGQPGWAPTSALPNGAEKLIDGNASTPTHACGSACEWLTWGGTHPTA
ncbi:MAG: hypothetical protein ACRDG4_03280, partial [Chloroflexota bacterium]